MPTACVTVDPMQPLEAAAASLTEISHVHEEKRLGSGATLF